MNNANRSVEQKTRDLLKALKRTPHHQEPGMHFMSAEEARQITEAEQSANKKTVKRRKVVAEEEKEEDFHNWKKGKKDTREIATVLPLGVYVKNNNIRVKGPVITPMMVEFFHKYLETHPSIKRIAVIGCNSGYTSETFLSAREDISVVAFDPLHYPYVNKCINQLIERYHNHFMIIGGNMSESIRMFASYLGTKRFDMIYIDSGSYPATAKIDLETSRFLAHAKTVVFMENVRPYSQTGSDAFEAWDTFVTNGILRELDDPHTWEELNRCVCEGMFNGDNDRTPLCHGERSRVRKFWETDPEAVLWKYGTKLTGADAEKAMEIWHEMLDNNIKPDRTALNMYVIALRKGADRKYQKEIENVTREFDDL